MRTSTKLLRNYFQTLVCLSINCFLRQEFIFLIFLLRRTAQRKKEYLLVNLLENQLIFIILGLHYWKNTENQQKFFIDFASHKGFDPLVPENWNNISTEDIVKQVRKDYDGCEGSSNARYCFRGAHLQVIIITISTKHWRSYFQTLVRINYLVTPVY